MFYREAGDFKTSYQDDNQTFPIKFDRYRYYFVLFVAFAIIPFMINDYWVNAVFLTLPDLCHCSDWIEYSDGLLRSSVSWNWWFYGGWGLYAVYKLHDHFPEINVFSMSFLAGVGHRILWAFCLACHPSGLKGFTCCCDTCCAVLLVWLFNRVPWFYNYSASGQISAPERTVFSNPVTGPRALGPHICFAWFLSLVCDYRT